ncbi:MAG: DUF3052 domain-containing protein [Phycisphaerales bacterium]|nr:DUF3052 domain-containing protein [Phycisphaerales bacterium]
MAMESACKLQVGKDRYDGQVRMEADHIDFAGATKFRFRLAEIANPRREDDSVRFSFHGNPVAISLPNTRLTESWIDYMLHPQTLADKLGVRDGHSVRILNLDDSELMSSLEDKKTKVVSNANGRCDIVMLGVERAAELRQIENLTANLQPDGAIWIVLPKSVRTVTKANVFAAAREAGMKHVEVIDFSENRAAYKIIRPENSSKRRSASGNGAARSKQPRRATVKT